MVGPGGLYSRSRLLSIRAALGRARRVDDCCRLASALHSSRRLSSLAAHLPARLLLSNSSAPQETRNAQSFRVAREKLLLRRFRHLLLFALAAPHCNEWWRRCN